ncbi:DUF4145 domain-containing protein [Bacillus timonensis]|uniref:DUF4145 domain-containing protein n=1 Tax=Bacillus timonensis TaxID=1033734 RepID=A0A4S3PRY9_9BACI|nr:DUF4145 domain-containing protein [Bacillus timonensis]THE12328.1 DUF4145 domain-containing protein [Bacillus timonensis]
MKNSVFHFIGDFSSQLEELALRVEALLWDQPQAAMTQARLFGELFVNMIFEQENMSEVYPLKLVEKINRLYRHDVIQDDMYKKLEFLRKNGNIASHQVLEMDQEVAKEAHRAIFDLGVWYAEVYVSHIFSAPSYELPSKQSQDFDVMKQWMDEYIKETQARISEIEEQLSQLKIEKKQHPVVKEKKSSTQNRAKNRIVPLERFQPTFENANFIYRNLSKKAAEFQFENFTTGYVYLLDNVTPTIVIHPWLVEQAKMFEEVQTKPVRSTALRKFPRPEEDGQLKSNYGYPFTFQTKGELKVLLQRIAEEFESKYMIK